MNALSRSFLLLASVILVTALVPILGCPTESQGQSDLTSRVETLEGQVAALNASLQALEAKLANVSVVQGEINGLAGPHLIIEGINLHVRDGSGSTDDNKALNGLGNLIIGYNELSPFPQFGRTGSHNLVIGSEHEYTSFGGLVAGRRNSVTGPDSSVSGGFDNVASGSQSSVSGGNINVARGTQSSVSGGQDNDASGEISSVSGGENNDASGEISSVSGGFNNEASGLTSSVSGGSNRTAPDANDWAAGSLFEDN